MTALHRKLFRDLWMMRGPFFAVGLVLACGVATYVMSLSTMSTLESTRAAYYERHRFADVFVHLKRAPEALAARMAEIPGIAHVETRIVQHVILDVPGLREPATARVVSIPDNRQPALNVLHLRNGRWPDPLQSGEVLVSDGFASAHRLSIGHHLTAIMNGRRQKLTITGIALSPEFIYQIREGNILPDERHFGIVWMPRSDLVAAFDLEGAFNDAAVSLAHQATEEEVIRRIDLLTQSYGGIGAFGRRDQASHKFISNEMNELRGMALVVPTIFLSVAGFLMHVVVSRLIGTQREQIATLKAFGYRSNEIGRHYWQMTIGIGLLGWLLGATVGLWLGQGVASMYSRFFHFPVFFFRLDPRVLWQAFGVSIGIASLASWAAVRWAMRLHPAEAMRPEPPAVYRATGIERAGWMRGLSPTTRMVLRQILRRPIRTGVTVMGLALSVAILILGSFMVDALDDVISAEFFFIQREDLTVTLVEPSVGRVASTLAHLPGVQMVEPFRAIPIRIRAGHRFRRLGLLGLQPDPKLFRVADVDRRVWPIPDDGVILSSKLADMLDARLGDMLTIEILEGERKQRSVRIAATITDFQGESMFASLDFAHRLLEEGDAISGVFLKADPNFHDALYRELKATPQIASVMLKQASLDTIRKTIAANILRMRSINVIFACIIACGVVYNSARIALAERHRDLATMRVLGFTRREVAAILLGELGILTTMAIPLGLLGGYWLADGVIHLAYDTELFRIPLVITRSTYAFAAVVTALAAAVSGWLVVRRLADIDLVAVLKARE